MSKKKLEGIIKEQNLVRLTLNGNRYEGIFLTEQKIRKIKLEDKFPAIWTYGYSFEGEGVIKDKKSEEEQKIFLKSRTNKYITRLKDYIICFDGYLKDEKITNYPAIIDLQLHLMYKKAQRGGNKKMIMCPKPLKIRDLVKRGFVK